MTSKKNKTELVNITGYKFVCLDDLPKRRWEMREFCQDQKIKGTILLSAEGINLFLAGARSAIDHFLSYLRSDPCFSDISVKESLSDHQPFNRMLVKLKNEIISFGVDEISPAHQTSPKLSARELKRWLDEGRKVTLLDVRNDYEVELGTFEDALPIGIDSFREFPNAVRTLPTDLKDETIVMFCTGGIRCEKAGPFMEREGFKSIFQLDGGILKYFEDCGGDHYDGECFVFDQRVAVDCHLEETETTQCFACQHPLSAEDQQSEEYIVGRSCPYCFKHPEQLLRERIEQRNHEIAKVTNPLPGSQPYDNCRPMNVPGRFDNFQVLDYLDSLHPHVGRDIWSQRCQVERILRRGKPLREDDIVRAGDRIEHLIPATVEPEVNANIKILFEDECLVVVDKSAPLPMHPSGRFHRNTLTHIVNRVFHPLYLRTVHRLDANTSGVVVLAKTSKMASIMQPQFKESSVKKKYFALVHGSPNWDEWSCDMGIGEIVSKAGTRVADENGLPAVTQFSVHQRREKVTLVMARPLTGRTNQIRIHLAHVGHPIVGDPTYVGGEQIMERQTLDLEAAPMCLHAAAIEITHPQSGKRMEFTSNMPDWGGVFST